LEQEHPSVKNSLRLNREPGETQRLPHPSKDYHMTAKWDMLAKIGRVEAIITFDDENTLNIDIYRLGESKTGDAIATFEIVLDDSTSPKGRVTLT